MIDKLLDSIAPYRCSSCAERGAILCESCKYDIISEPFSGCLFCARPCDYRGVCQKCTDSSKVIAQAWCVGLRRDGLKRLIDKYKFESSRAASGVLSELFDRIIPELPAGIVIVGIPSRASTIRVRGFDHIKRIAVELARKRKLSIAFPLEKISRATLHFLPRLERIKLGPSLFRLVVESTPEKVLLLDDIVTTGTTLTAAVKLLKKAGTKEVYIAVLARQPEE